MPGSTGKGRIHLIVDHLSGNHGECLGVNSKTSGKVSDATPGSSLPRTFKQDPASHPGLVTGRFFRGALLGG